MSMVITLRPSACCRDRCDSENRLSQSGRCRHVVVERMVLLVASRHQSSFELLEHALRRVHILEEAGAADDLPSPASLAVLLQLVLVKSCSATSIVSVVTSGAIESPRRRLLLDVAWGALRLKTRCSLQLQHTSAFGLYKETW